MMTKLTTVTATTNWKQVMTTNRGTPAKRHKHPASGARILATGISIASVLGLTSAYALAAQHSTSALASDSGALTPEIIQPAIPIFNTPVTAPTLPGPATPATTATSATPAITAPTVTPTIKIKTPKKTRSATKSGGSK